MKRKSGETYLKSLTKIADWAVDNCIDDQLPKAIELRNKIEKVRLSCQEENFDPILPNYKQSFCFHSSN